MKSIAKVYSEEVAYKKRRNETTVGRIEKYISYAVIVLSIVRMILSLIDSDEIYG